VKKEKWMLGEIEKWQSEEIINAETAGILKKRYEPKKNTGFLIILFSVIGTLFIGMGVILIGANNWWYSLPVAMRTAIAFLPLVASQALAIYVFKRRMDSTAFREGSAILNMAGVFSSIAIVGQIFHLPGDFTNYIFVCGILSMPTMLVMKAVSPLIIYYWTVLNGGLCLGNEWELAATLTFFAIGAVFAVCNFRSENGKSVYLAWLTLVSGFILLISSSIMGDGEPVILLFSYFALFLAISPMWEKAGQAFRITGTIGTLVMLAICTYGWCWEFVSEFEDITVALMTIVLVAGALYFAFADYRKNRKLNILLIAGIFAIAVRIVWLFAGLTGDISCTVFSVLFNIVMFATGIYFIWDGTKNVSLVSANVGMVTVCTWLVMRFFDSDMSLAVRGVAFLVLGIGFLLFNLRLIKIKKNAKEETV